MNTKESLFTLPIVFCLSLSLSLGLGKYWFIFLTSPFGLAAMLRTTYFEDNWLSGVKLLPFPPRGTFSFDPTVSGAFQNAARLAL